MIGTPTFDDRLSLGTVVTIITNIGLAFAFLFRRYYRAEEDTRRVDTHQKLLEEQTILLSRMTSTQDTQQKLLEHMDSRLARLEDHVYDRSFRRGER